MEDRDNYWGTLIRELREEQDISQRTLATGAKVNRSTLRRIEDGTASDDIKLIEKVLNFLGYELDALPRESKVELARRRAQEAKDPTARSKAAFNKLLNLPLAKSSLLMA